MGENRISWEGNRIAREITRLNGRERDFTEITGFHGI